MNYTAKCNNLFYVLPKNVINLVFFMNFKVNFKTNINELKKTKNELNYIYFSK